MNNQELIAKVFYSNRHHYIKLANDSPWRTGGDAIRAEQLVDDCFVQILQSKQLLKKTFTRDEAGAFIYGCMKKVFLRGWIIDKEERRIYSEKNKDHISKYWKEYYKNNKQKIIDRIKKHQASKKENYRRYKKAYYEKNKNEILAKDRAKYHKNKDKISAARKERLRLNKNKKVCSKCRIRKYKAEFNKDKRRKDGMSPYCKTCRRQIDSEYRKTNIDKIKKVNKEYYLSRREMLIRKSVEWQRKNRNHRNKYLAEWVKKYPQKSKEIKKKWYDENKDKVREIAKKYAVFRKINYAKWIKNNPDKAKAHSKKYTQKIINNLHDAYIINLLTRHGNYSRKEINSMPFLIDKKRLDVVLKRSDKLLNQNKKQQS